MGYCCSLQCRQQIGSMDRQHDIHRGQGAGLGVVRAGLESADSVIEFHA